jgi:hypothetical protein
MEPTSESTQAVVAQPSTSANLLNSTGYYEAADTKTAVPAQTEAAPAVQVNCGQECGCGACDPCCGHWILGIESVWLSPQLQRHAFAEYEIENDVSYGEIHGGEPSGLFMTPRITVGYQGECWGIQARYWRMNEAVDRLSPGIGRDIYDNFAAHGLFKAETIDLEATRLFCWRDWTNLASFGACYAQLDEATGSSATRIVEEEVLFQGSSFARNEFSGAGITGGLSGYKPLNCRCFNLFYSLRGSVLWDGDSLSLAQTQSRVVTPDFATAATDNGALVRGEGTMFIGEIQLGTQWNFELCRGCADAFVRLALEYQYWNTQDTGHVASVSNAFVSDGATTITGHAFARAGESRTDLIGFTVATGFTW